VHLAAGAAKNTGYVRAPVLRARVASSKHVSPFLTVGEGCISLVAEVEPRPLHPAEATALEGPLPREKRCF